MKKRLSILMLTLVSMSAIGQERFLAAGAASNKIAIINRETKQLEWTFVDPNKKSNQCNSLLYKENGDVMYVYKSGAKMITKAGDVIWEFTVEANEEMQTVLPNKSGYTIAIAGSSTTRILELDKNFKVKKEVKFDTGVTNVHAQYRQIARTKKGTYIVPIGSAKRLVELNDKGEVLTDISLENGSSFAMVDSNGDWFAACGHAGVVYKIDGKTKEVSEFISGKDLSDGSRVEFGAQIVELKNGNYMLANWLGHNGDLTQPILIELDKNGKVVWSMERLDGMTYVSAIYPIY